MNLLVEIIGWLGAAFVLAAYGLLSARRLSSQSSAYQVLNVAGAVGLVINAAWNGAIPSAAVNVIWLGIGVHALRRIGQADDETRPLDSRGTDR
jgi:hypothetical protein